MGTLGGFGSTGLALNDRGEVTGFSTFANSNADVAFVYNGTTMLPLPTLGGNVTVGQGINNSGEVTGYSLPSNSDTVHAFLYNGMTMQDLGTLGSGFNQSVDGHQ